MVALLSSLLRLLLSGGNVEEVLSAPASPWQRAFVERLIGSVRRDCLDHVIVLGEGHLRRILKSYLAYYHRSRTHLGLAKHTPEPRAVQPPEMGDIVELPQVGGLHHRYERPRQLNLYSEPSAAIPRLPSPGRFLFYR